MELARGMQVPRPVSKRGGEASSGCDIVTERLQRLREGLGLRR